jgi:hypothetical protein
VAKDARRFLKFFKTVFDLTVMLYQPKSKWMLAQWWGVPGIAHMGGILRPRAGESRDGADSRTGQSE